MIEIEKLKNKARWVRDETLKLHSLLPEVRVASCLSDIEIFVALYYGDILKYDATQPRYPDRDRFVISKGHGAVSLYPILADLGFFDSNELTKIGTPESMLVAIPDSTIPGFEMTNGSLGHGLGTACGIALGLRARGGKQNVYVLCGDGELNEGSVWEAVMLASFQKLSNLILIVDNNKISMLGYQKDILDLEPLSTKFEAFNWQSRTVDGHNLSEIYDALNDFKHDKSNRPKVLIADTVKGNGVADLCGDPLCHVRSLNSDVISGLIASNK